MDTQDPILTDHFWMNPIGVHFGDVNMSEWVRVPGLVVYAEEI